MLDNIKRVSSDTSILTKKISDESIHSQKSASSPVISISSAKKKKVLLFSEDSTDSDFEYY
jgi:hypothetical protein